MMEIFATTADLGSLNRALDLASKWSTRTMKKVVMDTARAVTFKAMVGTPAVSMQTIDSELDVITTPVLSTRGPRQGLPLKSGKKNYQVVEGGLATKIVLARMWPGSRYNRLTGSQWAIDRANFSPGEGVAGFWKKVELTAQRMVAARHSSTHFIQAGWGAVTKKLRALRFGAPALDSAIDVQATVTPADDDLGEVTYGEEQGYFWVKIENRVGMIGGNEVLMEKRNRALLKYGGPPLQAAADEQAAEMSARYLPREAEALAREFNAVR